MRLEGLIELRRHIRAIDIVLMNEIEFEKAQVKEHPAKDKPYYCSHPTCDPLSPCREVKELPPGGTYSQATGLRVSVPCLCCHRHEILENGQTGKCVERCGCVKFKTWADVEGARAKGLIG